MFSAFNELDFNNRLWMFGNVSPALDKFSYSTWRLGFPESDFLFRKAGGGGGGISTYLVNVLGDATKALSMFARSFKYKVDRVPLQV